MSATITNGMVLSRHNVNTDGIEHLDLEVPIETEPQAQGDVLIIPTDTQRQGEPITAKGVTVVRGETQGNAHVLHVSSGTATWAPNPCAGDELAQGWLTVEPDSDVVMLHTQEHNVIGIGPGSYEVKRQREFAGEWRRVSD